MFVRVRRAKIETKKEKLELLLFEFAFIAKTHVELFLLATVAVVSPLLLHPYTELEPPCRFDVIACGCWADVLCFTLLRWLLIISKPVNVLQSSRQIEITLMGVNLG